MAANNTGLRVALIEPSPRVGGMATAGGIGLKDLDATDWFDAMFAPGSVARKWIDLNGAAYGVPYALQVPLYQTQPQALAALPLRVFGGAFYIR